METLVYWVLVFFLFCGMVTISVVLTFVLEVPSGPKFTARTWNAALSTACCRGVRRLLLEASLCNGLVVSAILHARNPTDPLTGLIGPALFTSVFVAFLLSRVRVPLR